MSKNKECDILIGSKVKVLNYGLRYSTYHEMARKMKVHNWSNDINDNDLDIIYEVKDIEPHSTNGCFVVWIYSEKLNISYLIRHDGLKVVDGSDEFLKEDDFNI